MIVSEVIDILLKCNPYAQVYLDQRDSPGGLLLKGVGGSSHSANDIWMLTRTVVEQERYQAQQVGAQTGRFDSTKPNLSQVCKHRKTVDICGVLTCGMCNEVLCC